MSVASVILKLIFVFEEEIAVTTAVLGMTSFQVLQAIGFSLVNVGAEGARVLGVTKI